MPVFPAIAAAITIMIMEMNREVSGQDDLIGAAQNLWQSCQDVMTDLDDECVSGQPRASRSALKAHDAARFCERAREFTLRAEIAAVERLYYEEKLLIPAYLKAHACTPDDLAPVTTGLFAAQSVVAGLEPLAAEGDPNAVEILARVHAQVETLKQALAEIKARKAREAEVQAPPSVDPFLAPRTAPSKEFPVSLRIEAGYSFVSKVGLGGFEMRAFLQSSARVSRRIRLRYGTMAGFDMDRSSTDSAWGKVLSVHAGGHGEVGVDLYRSLFAAIFGVDFGMQFTEYNDGVRIRNTPAGAVSAHICVVDTVFCAGVRVGGRGVLENSDAKDDAFALSVSVGVGVDVVRGMRALGRLGEQKSRNKNSLSP